jgi:uncharacterized protein YeeX (DUF496 family)
MFSQLYWDLKRRINYVLEHGDDDRMDLLEIEAIMLEIQSAEDTLVDDYAITVEAEIAERERNIA